MPEQYFPVLLAMGVAIALGVIILIVSHLLSTFMGNQRGGRIKRSTIESGLPLLDTSQKTRELCSMQVQAAGHQLSR